MNDFRQNKKVKKFILVLVTLVLINFCFPSNKAYAGLIDWAEIRS